MASTYQIVAEDFFDELNALRLLVTNSNSSENGPRVRIAAANSATLLLAATFEEFVREMAREFARAVVASTPSFERLPSKMASTAWKRTMDGLSKIRFENDQAPVGQEGIFRAAHSRFSVIYEFCKGDLSQDIYRDLIHNENNMRPVELNGLFKLSGLGDICKKISDKVSILDVFGEVEPDKAHGKLISNLEGFFERRNAIAHALNPGQSSGSNQIMNDIDLFESFATALFQTLDIFAPAPILLADNNLASLSVTEENAGDASAVPDLQNTFLFEINQTGGNVTSPLAPFDPSQIG